MNDVLMFVATKLHQELTEDELGQIACCHRLLSALCKQQHIEQKSQLK